MTATATLPVKLVRAIVALNVPLPLCRLGAGVQRLGVLDQAVVAPRAAADRQQLLAVLAADLDLAGLDDLAAHPQEADEVHAVLGVVAVLGLERAALGVAGLQPALVRLPLLARGLVAALAVEHAEEVGREVALLEPAVAEHRLDGAHLILRDQARLREVEVGARRLLLRRVHHPLAVGLDPLELAHRVAGEAVLDPQREECVAPGEQLGAEVGADGVARRVGPQQLEHGRVGGGGEPEVLADLEADVIGGQLDLLGAADEAVVPGGGADEDALVVDVGRRRAEAVGLRAVDRLVEEEAGAVRHGSATVAPRAWRGIARLHARAGRSYRGACAGVSCSRWAWWG